MLFTECLMSAFIYERLFIKYPLIEISSLLIALSPMFIFKKHRNSIIYTSVFYIVFLAIVLMNLLLDLGVEEIILGYDREFEGGKASPDTSEYEEKLLKIVSPLLPYVNVSVIMDYEHLTPYKASPTDCGKEIFEKLYHNRIKLYTYTGIFN